MKVATVGFHMQMPYKQTEARMQINKCVCVSIHLHVVKRLPAETGDIIFYFIRADIYRQLNKTQKEK